MALNAPKCWLICHDIADPRRLSRLHRFLKGLAIPVQYSVFLYEGSAAQLGRLVPDIESRIDTGADDVRIYQMLDAPQFDTLGRGSLPSGAAILSERGTGFGGLARAGAD